MSVKDLIDLLNQRPKLRGPKPGEERFAVVPNFQAEHRRLGFHIKSQIHEVGLVLERAN